MFITANQIILHFVGDYLIQSTWMALKKTESKMIAMLHALSYSLPFIFLTRSASALFLIFFTHFLIDHYRLARYIVWFRNQLSPIKFRYKLEKVNSSASMPGAPDWLGMWLLFISDNIIHIIINALAIKYC